MSMNAVHDLEWDEIQVDSLLEAEGSKVLGVLVLHLSVKNLITFDNSQSSLGYYNLSRNSPNDQSGSSPDILPLSERILWCRADWEVEFSEAWGGSSSDHCLEADRRKVGRERGRTNVPMVRAFKQGWDP
jgi:hypothetical protein